MTFQRTSIDLGHEPFGPAFVGHNLHITFYVKEQNAVTEAFARRDLSGSTRYQYRLRIWTSDDDDALLANEALTEGSDAASGEINHYYDCGTTVRASRLRWSIVEVDTDTANENTVSGYVEVPKWHWYQPILDAPVQDAP